LKANNNNYPNWFRFAKVRIDISLPAVSYWPRYALHALDICCEGLARFWMGIWSMKIWTLDR